MEENTTPQEQPSVPQQVKRTPGIPAADANLLSLGNTVCTKWEETAILSLLWTNPAQFKASILGFKTSFHTKQTTGGSRSTITGDLTKLNTQIDTDTEYVKDYLVEKYTKKDATSHFATFGIVKTRKGYKLPADHQKRKEALEIMVEAITIEGFQNKTYGLAHWTAIKTKYDLLVGSASNADSTVSHHVGLKKQYKSEIRKTLNALIYLLRANYPDSYKAELRTWGFRKEKY